MGLSVAAIVEALGGELHGDPDRLITRRVRDALELIDVRLLDHLVIGDGSCVSLASRGML